MTLLLQNEVGDILSLSELPDPQKEFMELGMDSLMAFQLRDNLQALLGENHQLSAVVGFQYPNVKALAEYLIGQIFLMPNQPLNLSQIQDSDRVPTPLVSDNLIPKSLTENHSETNGLLQIATSMRSSGPSTDDLDNMSEQEIDYWLSQLESSQAARPELPPAN